MMIGTYGVHGVFLISCVGNYSLACLHTRRGYNKFNSVDEYVHKEDGEDDNGYIYVSTGCHCKVVECTYGQKVLVHNQRVRKTSSACMGGY